MNDYNQDSSVVCEITTNSEGQVMAQNVDTNVENKRTRLELLLENIDTSGVVRRQLEAAQKKLVEVEASIVLLSQQLSEKANTDVELTGRVLAMVESLRGVGLDDDVIAIAVSKQFSLSMPNSTRPNTDGSVKSQPNKTPESIAKKMGINESANEQIIAFVASHRDGVGMKAILERFPEYVSGDATKLAGYVRSLAETGKLMKMGEKKGTKYYAK